MNKIYLIWNFVQKFNCEVQSVTLSFHTTWRMLFRQSVKNKLKLSGGHLVEQKCARHGFVICLNFSSFFLRMFQHLAIKLTLQYDANVWQGPGAQRSAHRICGKTVFQTIDLFWLERFHFRRCLQFICQYFI